MIKMLSRTPIISDQEIGGVHYKNRAIFTDYHTAPTREYLARTLAQWVQQDFYRKVFEVPEAVEINFEFGTKPRGEHLATAEIDVYIFTPEQLISEMSRIFQAGKEAAYKVNNTMRYLDTEIY